MRNIMDIKTGNSDSYRVKGNVLLPPYLVRGYLYKVVYNDLYTLSPKVPQIARLESALTSLALPPVKFYFNKEIRISKVEFCFRILLRYRLLQDNCFQYLQSDQTISFSLQLQKDIFLRLENPLF